MAYLLDTSVLARLANAADSLSPAATRAVVELHRRAEVLHITAQNLIEFRNAATRAVAVNGLGLGPPEAEVKAAEFEAEFRFLPEVPAIFPAWKALVVAQGVIGKQVHDARLVAVCHVYGITHLLTFNIPHFARLSAVGPGLIVVNPASV